MSDSAPPPEPDFAELLRRHRHELHVHCERILGSFEEAEDIVQETLLRAWNRHDSIEIGPGFRAWLYRVATNACLDALRSRKRTVAALGALADLPWPQPHRDPLLDESRARTDTPEAVVVARETIELAFLAAVELLPVRQQAVLLLRDLLGWSAAESAMALATSVPAANSALQRARVTLREHLPADRADWPAAAPNATQRAVLESFVDAYDRADIPAMSTLMRYHLSRGDSQRPA